MTTGNRRELAFAYQTRALAAQAQHDPIAISSAERAAELFSEDGDDWGQAFALFYLGVSAFFLERPSTAVESLSKARDLFSTIGDEWGIAGALFYLGAIAHKRGQRAEAIDTVDQALSMFRNSGDPWRTMVSLDTLTRFMRAEGHDTTGLEQQAHEIRTRLGLA